MANSIRLEMHGALHDLPVHARFTLPDFDGLFLSELIAQAMPRSGASVGHGFDKVSHQRFPLGNSRHKALRDEQHRPDE
ncbi:TPA: hypothetical protein ACRNW4_003291 [Pseudomonas aeruginosa]|uniref:hypothetical protein n=1 Tax=Pseudomonas aeruginosa TaxID=287 RepID=UPI001F09D708|nr:hypothetical protein [Pseudomonas aeruginosa]WOD36889.1 hypothetical protein RYH83_11870 [Pseudomonas aeruginosa]